MGYDDAFKHRKDKSFRCECGSLTHQVEFTYWDNDGEWNGFDHELFITINLNKTRGLWSRLKYAFKYLIGTDDRFGGYEGLTFSPEQAKEMISFMQNFVDNSEGIKP